MVALAIAERVAPAATGASLDVEGVSHGFDIDGAVLPVLDNVSFRVKPGEFVALLATEMLPVALPDTDGSNVTVSVAVCPAVRISPR